MIELKTDNRYKDGNVVKKNGKLRGNAKTMQMDYVQMPQIEANVQQAIYNDYLRMTLFPPIVVSGALGDAIKESIDA